MSISESKRGLVRSFASLMARARRGEFTARQVGDRIEDLAKVEAVRMDVPKSWRAFLPIEYCRKCFHERDLSRCACRSPVPQRAQPTLDFTARTTDPDTSHERVRRLNHKGAGGKTANRIIALLGMRDTVTAKESAVMLDMELCNVSPAFAPMKRAGLIELTGEKRDRCQVWRLTARLRPGVRVLT